MKKVQYTVPLLGLFTLLAFVGCGGCVDQKSPGSIIQGSFFNVDTTDRTQIRPFHNKINSWSGSTWRGERISSQLLIWVPETTMEINLSNSGLSGKKNTLIPADQIKLYEIKYVKTDVFAEGCEKTGIANYDSSLVADLLEPIMDPLLMTPGVAILIWVSIDIPSETMPGNYSGSITVTTDRTSATEFQIDVEVLPKVLPPPSKWNFHLDLWQNPYSVARYYEVDPWSEEHFEKMRPTMEMLANAGQKCITTTLTAKPWGGQTFDPFESMIKKTRKRNGSWTYDYSDFDAWVDFAMRCGIDQQINCYSMVSWTNEYNFYDEVKGEELAVSCKPGEKEYSEIWAPFLKDFNEHLLQKKWHNITTISMDERSMEDLMEVIKLIESEAPGLKIAFAGRYHPELDEALFDLSVASAHIIPPENLAGRKAAGFKTTFYVCCVEEEPNTFSFSNPAEASYLAWYAANRDFDGMLRWSYNSWTQHPLHDSRFRRFPGGDTYIVYPGGLSSVRFERLREGIQDFEKISILKRELLAEGSEASKEKLKLLNTQLAKFDILSLSNITASETLTGGKQLLYQLSR